MKPYLLITFSVIFGIGDILIIGKGRLLTI